MPEKKLPIGIQTFSRIRQENYLYVDKTDLMWALTQVSPFVFLSRPRRFGKSLLSSTLASYFQGKRELFAGLKIMSFEKDWKQYPVLHFDLSVAKAQASADALASRLLLLIGEYADIYGRVDKENTPGAMLQGVIRRAHEMTGSPVVLLFDEYDAPLLDVLGDQKTLSQMRRVMQEFYAPLKACEGDIKFCFITGITKFSQLSIFSTINNLTNVSMDPRFGTICGITEDEMVKTFADGIASLAQSYECTREQMIGKLRLQYDGYHFSHNSAGVYNPFSLLKSFAQQDLSNWWFESGTPTFLIHQMQLFRTDITELDGLEVPSDAFDVPTEGMTTALPLLYQSGYLTIKAYDREIQSFTLSIPNQEVRVGFVKGLIPAYTGLDSANVQMGFAAKFWRALKMSDIDLAMKELQAFLSGVPYVDGFKKKLSDAATAEGFYEYTLYLIFATLNVYVQTQVKCAGGRIDMVVLMPDTTYVFEFKTKGSAQNALAQINDKEYFLPFRTVGRKVVKVGVKMNSETRSVEDWCWE